MPTDPLSTLALATGGAFLGKFVGPAAEHYGKLALERAQQLGTKATAYLAAVGREPQPVEPKLLVPLVQAAALETDESLADKWAALLANAADPVQRVQVQVGFAEALRQFSPTDAKIAEAIYFPNGLSQGEPVTGGLMPKDLIQRLGLTYAAIGLSVDNLLRLRVCKAAPTYGDGDPMQAFTVPATIMGTLFGLELMRACTPPTA